MADVPLRIRYFAGAAAAAGVDEETVDTPQTATLSEVCDALAARHPGLGPVLDVSSLLVDEVPVADRTRPVGAAVRVDVLPPFAGG